MPGAWRLVLVTLPALSALGACALAYPYDELTGGNGDAGAGDAAVDVFAEATADAPTAEAAADAPFDGPFDAPVDAPPDAGLDFFDDFDRDGGGGIGNGWIMKNPAAFVLTGGEVIVQGGNVTSYRDNVVYRPSPGEDVLDVEASIELHVHANPPGYPQVLVRVQGSTVATPNTLDAYMLFIHNTDATATLARQHGSSIYVDLTDFNLAHPINTTDTFRLRLQATGASPAVSLTAFVEYLADGGTWIVSGSTSFTDSDTTQQITTAGSVGFSSDVGDVTDSYSYGNFRRTPL